MFYIKFIFRSPNHAPRCIYETHSKVVRNKNFHAFCNQFKMKSIDEFEIVRSESFHRFLVTREDLKSLQCKD